MTTQDADAPRPAGDPGDGGGATRLRSPIFWIALTVALSPSIYHVLSMIRDFAWTRPVCVGIALLVVALPMRRHDAIERHPRLGLCAVVLGLLVQLVGVASGSWSIARLGLPVALCGMAALLGRPSLPVAALAFWTVPIPNMLVVAASPWLETAAARFATGVAALFGVSIDASGPLLHYADQRLEFTDYDGGVLLAVLLAGLGWYAAVRAGAAGPRGLLTALGRALRWGALVVLLQPAVAVVAVVLLAAGAPKAGARWLETGYWIVVAICGFAWIEGRALATRWHRPAAQVPRHS